MKNWDATIQTDSKHPVASGVVKHGCLVKIHPMDLENKLVRLNQRKTTIGREPGNDLFCDDSSISRQHACVVKDEHGFHVQDLGSTNGTFVNGQPVDQQPLVDGDKVQVGNHIFKFLAGDSIESQYHETVYSMMTMDGLTNVYNKRYLVDAIARELDRANVYGRPFSLVMIDIDFFKKFNDSHGHLAGDEVLQEFAKRLQLLCGTSQVLARFGGEEFALLMIETELGGALGFAEQCRSTIADRPFECCAGSLNVTASFGVAQYDREVHANFSDLIEEADRCLYLAKEKGRNQVCGTSQQNLE